MLSKCPWPLLALTLILSFGRMPTAHAEIELGKSLKEIFIKGSLDGDKLFMVLGMEDATRYFKDALKEAIDIEDLKDWSQDSAQMVQEQVRRTWNSDHNGDMVDNLAGAAHVSMEAADGIYKWPWRSLKRIPQAFKVGMNDAREARANASNNVAGTLAFSGLAAWTSIKGAYYLVIEAPVSFVAALAATTLPLPATLAYEAIRLPIALALGIAGKTLRLGWMASKAIVLGATAVGAITYSALSTGVAIAATGIATGAVAAFRFTLKVLKLPFRMFKRGLVQTTTTIKYDQLKEVAQIFPELLSSEILSKLGVDESLDNAQLRIEDHKAILKFGSTLKDGKNALTIKFGIDFNSDKELQFITVEAYLQGAHFRALKKETGLNTSKLRTVVESNLAALLSEALLQLEYEQPQTESELALAI